MISPTLVTPTSVTSANQSTLEEGTATDLSFFLQVQQNKQQQTQILSWLQVDASARTVAADVVTAPDLDLPAQLSGLTLAQPHHHNLAWEWGLGAAPPPALHPGWGHRGGPGWPDPALPA